MKEEVIPEYYLCTIGSGVAYYFVSARMYDQIHTEHNGQNERLSSAAFYKKLTVEHILSRTLYDCEFHKVKVVTWASVPTAYQLDALALNEHIRRYKGKDFEHVNNQNMQAESLRGVLFGVVNQVTGKLDILRANGKRHAAVAELEYVPATVMATPIPITHAYASTGTQAQQLANNSGNNTQSTIMDLTSNIPGMKLDFGKLQSGLIALSLNGDIAFKGKDGQYVTIQTDGTEKTRVEVGNLKLDVDFYKVPTQELEEGDIILLDNEFLVAGKKVNGDTKFINPLTGATTNKLQRTNILGMYFYTKIVSLFDMAGGTAKGVGLSGIDPMMLMMMSGQTGTGGNDIGQLLMFSALSKGGSGDTNSMLPLLMMSGGLNGGTGDNGGIGQLLMMQALSGNKGGLGNLFGKNKSTAKVAPKKVAPKKKAAIKKTTVRNSASGG